MAFSKKTWKDRISQYINRRLLTDSDGNTQQVTVTRDEGSVTEAGDAFSASNMNDLENRIEAAIPVKIQDLDNVNLNTSDNNKLLGVSVSGSDISVGAVDKNPVSVITAITNDATGISDNDTLIVRYGNLIIMSISFTLSQSYADQWKNIFSFDDTSLSIAGIAGYIGAVNVENSIATYGQIYTNNGHITYRVRNPQGSRTYRGQLIFPIT